MTEIDCGTEHGLLMSPHIEGGDVVEPLGERVLGRVIARDVFSRAATRSSCRPAPDRREVGGLPRSDERRRSGGAFPDHLRNPSGRLRRLRFYGRDLARGHRVNIGEAVGVIAAHPSVSRAPS